MQSASLNRVCRARSFGVCELRVQGSVAFKFRVPGLRVVCKRERERVCIYIYIYIYI